jgi:hypothetical protein
MNPKHIREIATATEAVLMDSEFGFSIRYYWNGTIRRESSLSYSSP